MTAAFRIITGVVAACALLPGAAAADVPADRYHIISVLTGECLALGPAVVELADCGGNATGWDIVPAEPAADGQPPALLIRHVVDCVGHDGAIAECGDPSQLWTVEQTETGDFTILSAPDRLALSVVPGDDETAVAAVQTLAATASPGGFWQLAPVE